MKNMAEDDPFLFSIMMRMSHAELFCVKLSD